MQKIPWHQKNFIFEVRFSQKIFEGKKFFLNNFDSYKSNKNEIWDYYKKSVDSGTHFNKNSILRPMVFTETTRKREC